MIRESSIPWRGVALALAALALTVTIQPVTLLSPFVFPVLLIVFGAGVAMTAYALSRLRVRELESAQTSSNRNLRESARALRDSEERLGTQSAALTALMERQARNQILEDRVPEILETCAQTIGVRRASMWQFAEDRSAIHCVDLYDLETRQHTSGQTIRRVDFPAYFCAVEHDRLNGANN